MTQEKFGNELGVTKTAISKMELGIYSVTDTMIRLICSTFNVNETWLRTGEGEMFCEISEDDQLMRIMAMATKVENQKLKDALLLLPKLSDDQLVFLAEFIKKIKG